MTIHEEALVGFEKEKYDENPANWIKTTKQNCNKFAIMYIMWYKINKKIHKVLTYTWDGFDKHWQENRAQQGSG